MPVGVCWLLLETYAKTCVLHVGSTSEKSLVCVGNLKKWCVDCVWNSTDKHNELAGSITAFADVMVRRAAHKKI